MEVEAGSRASCTNDYFSPPVAPVADLECVSNEAPRTNKKDPSSSGSAKNADSRSSTTSGVHNTTKNSEATLPERPSTSVAPVVNAKTNVGKYRLLRTIGKGNFAKVKLAIHMATGVEVAIKIINKTVMDSTLLKRLKREITIMKVTNHPNIVRLLEIIENEDVLCLVMEYASGGEIFDYLVANGKMREKEARVKFRQLLSAIQYCHSKRIVHRDLKAENILLDRNLNVKVADFGLANNFDYDQRLTTFCGSPPYAAPELFLGIPYYGPGVDVWSLGVILFTLVLGHLPFDARDLRELRSKILGLHYTIPKGAISPECEALLRKMLVLDPKDRSSLKVLMQDKWINAGYAPSEQLRPYKEPPKSQLDEVRVNAMEAMGFTRADLESSVVNPEFDHVYATYHLLPETPSQFMVLCEELTHSRGQSQGAPPLPTSFMGADNQAAPVQPPPTTAIGRFTVAPSTNVTDPSVRGAAAVPSIDSPATQLQRKQPPYPMVDSSSREHHSLTSALPVALRKAIVQMGRTFGAGGTYTGGTPTSGSTVGPDTTQRTATSVGGRSSTRPPSKQTDDRSAVTTAPVPMGPGKKTAAGTSSKRSSPGGQTPVSGPYSGRSGSSDSSSTTHPSSGVRTSHPPGYATTNVTPQPSPSTLADRTLKKSPAAISSQQPAVNKRDSPPVFGKPQPTGFKKSPRNTAVDSRLTGAVNKDRRAETPRDSLSVAAAPSDHPTSKVGLSSGGTSSESYGDGEVRQTAVALVENIWQAMGRESTHAVSPSQTTPEAPKTSAPSVTDAPSEVEDSRRRDDSSFEPAADSETMAKEINERLSTGAWSADADRHVIPAATDLPPQILHTVQGTEAAALRDEAMRLRTGGSLAPTATPPLTLDPNHQNTWSKGVLKALGGLFNPSKPQEHRQFPENTDVEFLAKPREVRFPWSVHTTSTKSAEEVLQSIIEALEVTPGCRYAYDTHLPFLVRCSWAADRPALRPDPSPTQDASKASPMPSMIPSGLREDPVHWEMEVCQLPRLHLRGVRLKRIRGSALHFRPIADLVRKSLRL